MTFVTSPGQTDPVRQLSRGPLVASTVHGQPFFNCSRATWVLVTRNLCIYKNSLLNSLMQWSPWPNYCSQTSIKQKTTRQDKTTKELCCICQGPQLAERMDSGKVAEGWFFPIAANTEDGLLEPAWTQDSPRKQSSLVEEKSWFGVTSSMRVCTFGWSK